MKRLCKVAEDSMYVVCLVLAFYMADTFRKLLALERLEVEQRGS